MTGSPWRQHPLLKRLPLLVLAVLGLWLWKRGEVPERELVWRLEGRDWSAIRSIDVQVKDADDELVKREIHTFTDSPPSALIVKATLPSGAYEVWIFARGASGPSLPPRVDRLTLTDEDIRVERGLRAPVNR
ncbi:hypothetical protein [Melittangium boletus]|uniref:Uncharacterized protein n=1 Tax=Melittangium boletus DSM 14713 TaxID=1294270 RepID=A0A250IR43_9BACT|nr:hypothetical protein [Melittangium boletus]ATB33723.1 hypothetical protein MEBOL_007221 [Melittangium boletus DSM 14713]